MNKIKIGNRLDIIYKKNIKAGELWVDDKGYHFEYDDGFMRNETVRSISINIPKNIKRHHSKHLFPYFKSILCEGENRNQISKSLNINLNDDWSLLALTCQYDTIGSITIKII